ELRAVVEAEEGVDAAETLRRCEAVECDRTKDRAADGHEERGRDALAGDVADDDAEVRVVDREEVVEVSADLAGREHLGEELEVRATREGTRQDRLLDAARDVELAADREELLAIARRLLEGEVLLLQLRVHAGILDGDGDAAGERFEEGELIVGEARGISRVHDLDHADRSLMGSE